MKIEIENDVKLKTMLSMSCLFEFWFEAVTEREWARFINSVLI